MATVKQKKAAKVVISGGTPTDGMRAANYAPSVIRKPIVLTESQGYKEALAEYGLTEELITSALVEDIAKKPQKRLGELSLGADILGMKKGDENQVPQINIIFNKINQILQDESPGENRQTTPNIQVQE